MAPISKLIPFLFLTTLLVSLQVNARDSQFFSKVTPLNNNIKETETPKNEGQVNKPEQQPTFIPETENSYGLYGHETGLHPPTTTTTNAAPYTTTYKPYKTTTAEEDTAKYSNNNNFYSFKKDGYNTNQNELSETTRLTGTSYTNNNNYFYSGKDAFAKQNELSDTKYTEGGYNTENQNSNNNYFYNGKDAFGKQNELSDTKYTEEGYNSMENQNNNNNYYNGKDAFGKQNELSDTKYTEEGYNSMENQNNNNNNNKYYYNNDQAANEKYFYNNNNNDDAANNRYYKTKSVNSNYNGERQGLSDTRFIEGGKYFYDVKSEKYNHPTQYGGSTRGVNSENWSSNRGYFGNNNVNSMEGYQNQEEFEDDQEDFDP
ncbi:hypothetical protein GLYMA_13G175300v4 [Glycine max]|uniref:Protein E6 n=1 Tax=Glycine max TaxID=3847 RepID=I1M070_SOYBN|nr:protein E6-like precursor [Glycine max]KAH1102042.1 hypothetical protein GYH30_036543 [Glycine max]KRH20390.1 hypothetical protein GLYMA_13G175300v4 [Glycine max]